MCPFSFYHNSRFRKPPCNPGRSDFPNPVLISAPQVIFQIMAFLYNPRIKCQLTYTQNHTVYQYPRFERQVHFIQFSDWMHIPYSKPPSTQSPFAQCGCYPSLGRLKNRLRRHYSSFIAHTDSCAKPHPSRRLGFPCTLGLCRLSPVPAGKRSFPTLSLQSLRRRLDPYSAVFPECTYPFLPQEHRPHAMGNAFGTRNYPCYATSAGSRISELQSFVYLQAPTLARPPGRTHR